MPPRAEFTARRNAEQSNGRGSPGRC
jgi:hypothetical protein